MASINKQTKEKQAQTKVFLKKLLKQPGNTECMDCTSPNPTWASINLGIFICARCSGIHRNMGVHISKVRSASGLDLWEHEQLKFVASMGNTRAKEIYEAYLPPGYQKPSMDDPALEQWIRTKYENKKYWRDVGQPPPGWKSKESVEVDRKKRKEKLRKEMGGAYSPSSSPRASPVRGSRAVSPNASPVASPAASPKRVRSRSFKDFVDHTIPQQRPPPAIPQLGLAPIVASRKAANITIAPGPPLSPHYDSTDVTSNESTTASGDDSATGGSTVPQPKSNSAFSFLAGAPPVATLNVSQSTSPQLLPTLLPGGVGNGPTPNAHTAPQPPGGPGSAFSFMGSANTGHTPQPQLMVPTGINNLSTAGVDTANSPAGASPRLVDFSPTKPWDTFESLIQTKQAQQVDGVVNSNHNGNDDVFFECLSQKVAGLHTDHPLDNLFQAGPAVPKDHAAVKRNILDIFSSEASRRYKEEATLPSNVYQQGTPSPSPPSRTATPTHPTNTSPNIDMMQQMMSMMQQMMAGMSGGGAPLAAATPLRPSSTPQKAATPPVPQVPPTVQTAPMAPTDMLSMMMNMMPGGGGSGVAPPTPTTPSSNVTTPHTPQPAAPPPTPTTNTPTTLAFPGVGMGILLPNNSGSTIGSTSSTPDMRQMFSSASTDMLSTLPPSFDQRRLSGLQPALSSGNRTRSSTGLSVQLAEEPSTIIPGLSSSGSHDDLLAMMDPLPSNFTRSSASRRSRTEREPPKPHTARVRSTSMRTQGIYNSPPASGVMDLKSLMSLIPDGSPPGNRQRSGTGLNSFDSGRSRSGTGLSASYPPPIAGEESPFGGTPLPRSDSGNSLGNSLDNRSRSGSSLTGMGMAGARSRSSTGLALDTSMSSQGSADPLQSMMVNMMTQLGGTSMIPTTTTTTTTTSSANNDMMTQLMSMMSGMMGGDTTATPSMMSGMGMGGTTGPPSTTKPQAPMVTTPVQQLGTSPTVGMATLLPTTSTPPPSLLPTTPPITAPSLLPTESSSNNPNEGGPVTLLPPETPQSPSILDDSASIESLPAPSLLPTLGAGTNMNPPTLLPTTPSEGGGIPDMADMSAMMTMMATEDMSAMMNTMVQQMSAAAGSDETTAAVPGAPDMAAMMQMMSSLTQNDPTMLAMEQPPTLLPSSNHSTPTLPTITTTARSDEGTPNSLLPDGPPNNTLLPTTGQTPTQNFPVIPSLLPNITTTPTQDVAPAVVLEGGNITPTLLPTSAPSAAVPTPQVSTESQMGDPAVVGDPADMMSQMTAMMNQMAESMGQDPQTMMAFMTNAMQNMMPPQP